MHINFLIYRFAAITIILFFNCNVIFSNQGIVEIKTNANERISVPANSENGREIGANGRFLSKTKIITAKSDDIYTINAARKKMKEIKRQSLEQEIGPLSIEDAAALLSRRINMANPPTKCFEFDGYFFFSGGLSANPVEDFKSGYAVMKGVAKIYEWSLYEDENPKNK